LVVSAAGGQAAVGIVPVIWFQVVNRETISVRYSWAVSRCRRGRKSSDIPLKAEETAGPRPGSGTLSCPLTRAMSERAGATVTEAPGSHAIYVSRPQAVADLIKQAAEATGVQR
jgi:hypothetical protein